ncbi:hypothetical protein I6F50_15100 [Pseudoalteromonas sp. NZS127_1]|jgi:hypothetical protein|uniref:Class IIb bacteriocin, lactobin A/cerein 7B family n=1 Tax=Pseudoalteromonas arctica TaxID=394751 RepID=A0ABU9TFV9_9GAMM|nr:MULTISPECIES: hypothetical protein [Pseudoalteromonas]MBG9996386.1 hypothetical protein [Pseudoalteromonas sp. NZS127_1]MBG9998584.1 hypothetical protein [Pseudoalteromonas sp. NSLLW24]MBH0012886.1 hypothetical protein [Pseudoalteromonas sp. NZS100_1]MBH0034894.1 hypothetical protein [Pseudoalteromonas sp. NZS71_1]MBH0042624.1 hypothetical protein [Pseudoalteromonas sp. SWXJZ10B]
MRELTSNEIQEINGGPLPFIIAGLYASSSITAGGLATAIGIGAGFGAIVGGIAAVYHNAAE